MTCSPTEADRLGDLGRIDAMGGGRLGNGGRRRFRLDHRDIGRLLGEEGLDAGKTHLTTRRA